MKFYLAQSCLEPLNVCHVAENRRLTSLVTWKAFDTLMTMEKGRSRTDVEPVRRIGSPGSFMEQAIFYCGPFSGATESQPRLQFAQKDSWKPSPS